MGLLLAEPDFHTRCFVEWDKHARARIIAAQRAGYFAPAPIWDDITTFDGRELRGCIDTILAGYPCQPFSAAGQRKGEADERHLWPDVARVIREVQPRWVFLENVAGHVSLGAETVLRELWGMGWTPAAGLFSAEEVGAPHERLRWFCVAYKPSGGRGIGGDAAQPGRGGEQRGGEQRFQPEGGKTGRGNVDDARCAERGQVSAEGDQPDRQAPGRIKGAGWAEQPGQHVDNTAGSRCDAARIGPETNSEGGKCLSGAGCDNLADASGPRPQGREQPRSPDQRDRASAHGSATECRGLPLFPPGPAANGQWAAVMASSPDLSPSFARRDALAATVNIASLLTPNEAEALEPRLRGIPRGAGVVQVVEKAPELVGQAQALTGLRNVADGLAERTRALRILGNGVVPLSAAYAWRTLAASHCLVPVDLEATRGKASDDPNEPVWRGVV